MSEVKQIVAQLESLVLLDTFKEIDSERTSFSSQLQSIRATGTTLTQYTVHK